MKRGAWGGGGEKRRGGEGGPPPRREDHDPPPVAVEERPGQERQGDEPSGQLRPRGAAEEQGKRGSQAAGHVTWAGTPGPVRSAGEGEYTADPETRQQAVIGRVVSQGEQM